MDTNQFQLTKKAFLFLFFFLITTTAALAQGVEICNNGLDDDHDGYVDCFDKKCASSNLCEGNYFGSEVTCQVTPAARPKFSMKLLWGSANKTTNHLNRASVGDLNRDGVPEVVVTEIENDFIYILDGKTGSTKKSLKVGYSLDREIAIANINNTSCGQIFVSGGNNIYAYDCNLNFLWKSTTLNDAPAQFGIADFDGDGLIEIYCRDEIIDAHTGIRIVKGTNTSKAAGQPIAVDVINPTTNPFDTQLELVSGLNIYSVNLGARTLNSGSLTLLKSAPSFFMRQLHTSTSVVDYDKDGVLDIIASGSDGATNANTTVFYWNFTKDPNPKKYIDKIASTVFIAGCSNTSGTYYKNGWQNGTGRINIADIDGDGKLNASFVSGKFLYALDENWQFKWKVVVNEETSGYTGCTVYDFNGDGSSEIVYRDEQFLYIINGKDGSINTQQQCIARTNVEYPIVADINGDGSTELCVTCGFDDKLAWSNFCNLSYSVNSHVRVFQSAKEPWVPSRRLWNQHAYFNVNVNDDLTIPKVVQKHNAKFNTGTCGDNRALNTFLNQTPFLDDGGCIANPAPRLVNVKSSLLVVPPTCPDKNFTVTLGIKNEGSISVNADVPVTFYKGNPKVAGSVKLNTTNINLNLNKGEQKVFPNITVTGTGGAFRLYISLNDPGTLIPPIVLNQSNTPIVQCSYDSAISYAITPKSIHLTALKIADDIWCNNLTTPVSHNGAARAFVDSGGIKDSVNYDFFWYDGVVAGTQKFKGTTYTKLGPGTYKVFARHKVAGCNSDTATVLINQIAKAPLNVAIVVDKPNTSCGIPNGQFHAVVNNGDPVNNYTFKWYEGNDFVTSPEIATGHIASNLKGGKTYTVLVTDNFSGCEVVASLAVPDVTSAPVVSASATKNAKCSPPNSGEVSATVNGVTIGYNFDWYNGVSVKPVADNTPAGSSVYSDIPAGSYTVVATEIASGCKSLPLTINVNAPPSFSVTASPLTPQTNCSPAIPNGSVTADVGGVTAGFTFDWFKGQGTNPANAVAGPTSLAAGIYTVKATNNLSGCSATAETTVVQNTILPIVTLTPLPNAVCDILKATSQYTGSVTAAITYNGVAVTDFTPFKLEWHKGSLVTDPATGTNSQLLSQVQEGDYTLLVTKISESCVAAPVTATVTKTPPVLVLNTAQSPSHNCNAGPAGNDGSAEVIDINGVSVAATTNYSYQWFNGIGMVTKLNGETNPKLQNQKGGTTSNFTVLVTDKTTGCENTATVLIGDAQKLPVLTLKTTPNTMCDALKVNGTASQDVLTDDNALPTDTYTFTWTDTNGNPSATTASTLINQKGGNCTAIVRNNRLGCSSNPVTIQIKDDLTLPNIDHVATPSTNCAGAPDNGVLTASVTNGKVGETFSFQWFTVTPLASIANTATANNLAGGKDYQATVTNNVTGCANNKVVTLTDSKELPTLTLTAQPTTICDATIATSGAFDGQVSADIVTVGNYASSVPADFNYKWNTDTSPVVGKSLLPNVDVGTYTIFVEHIATKCTSTIYSAQVKNSTKLPTIITDQQGSTNCAGGVADGVAKVTNVIPNGKHYNYRWFDGDAAMGTPAIETLSTTLTSNDYSGVLGGLNGAALRQYTVEVTILETGCKNTEVIGVDDDSQPPLLGALVPTDNTNCNASKNGAATVSTLTYRGITVNPINYSDYDFVWTGTGTQGPPQTFTGLAAGDYTLTAKNKKSLCISNPVSVTIKDNLFIPKIDVATIDQTSCNPLNPNGSVSASIDETSIGGVAGVIAGYSFKWDDLIKPATVSVATFNNLKGNQNYTITATRTSTGCSNTQVIFLNETITFPTVTVAVTDLTLCAPVNGQLVATPNPAATYNFFWYKGSDAIDENAVIAGADPAATTATYAGLIPGDYTLVIQNTTTKCKSSQVIKTVKDLSPKINPVAQNTILPADCNTNGGEMDGAVQSFNTNFTAATGSTTITVTLPFAIPDDSKVLISRDAALQLPVPLRENNVYFIKKVTATTYQLSLTAGGAPISFTSNGNGVVGDFVVSEAISYSYKWFDGVPSPTNVGQGAINYLTNPPIYSSAALGSASKLSNLKTGIYTVEVTDLATGCKNFHTQSLPFIGSHAVLKITKTNSTICSPGFATGNGSIEIQIESPASAPPGTNQSDYEITLKKGATTTVPTFKGPANLLPFYVANGILAPASYVVEVKETYSTFNCVIAQDVIIDSDAFAPVVSLSGPILPNTACIAAGADGRIDILVEKDSKDITVATTYTIDFNPDPNAAFPLVNQPVGNYSALNLTANTYSVNITDSNNCFTQKSYTVIDSPVKSELTATDLVLTDAEFCDVNLETSAKAVVTQVKLIGGGAENINDYQFDWFINATLATNILSSVGNNTATKGGEELSNVGAPFPSQKVTNQDYWLTVTKKTDASGTGGIGCVSPPLKFQIDANKINPQIVLTPAGDPSCNTIVSQGSITVDVTTASGPGSGVGKLYDYVWNPTGAAGQPANSINQSGIADLYTGINDGTYTLTATNKTTGCVATLSTTVVKDAPPVFTVDATETNLTNCVGTGYLFNGKIDAVQVFVNGLAGTVSDFDYIWFKSDLLPASKVLDGEDVLVVVDNELTETTYPAISPEKYFVKAKRKAGGAGIGCESAPLRKDILDDTVLPQIAVSSTSNDACPNPLLAPIWNGSLKVEAGTPGFSAGTLYDFAWTLKPGTAGIIATDASNTASVAPVTPSLLSLATYTSPGSDQIAPGPYEVQVQNKTNGCIAKAMVTVTQKTVPIAVEADSIPNTHCTVDNGAIQVTDVRIGAAAAALTDFSYSWTGLGGPYATQNLASLKAGSYTVIATKTNATTSRTAYGCSSAPLTVSVTDQTVSPTVNATSVANTACDTNFDGQITVLSTTSSTQPAVAGANYDFTWTAPGGSVISNRLNIASPYVPLAGDLIGPGIYTVQVTNVANQCKVSASINVLSAPVVVEILSATKKDKLICNPDGEVKVVDVAVDGTVDSNHANFTFDWYRTSALPPTILSGPNDLLDKASYAIIDADSYFVVAKRNGGIAKGSGCSSAPYRKDIADLHVNPIIAAETQSPDFSCAGTNGSGQIQINEPTNNYTFSWFAGNSATGASFATGKLVNGLQSGIYTVQARDIVSNCVSVKQYSIQRNPAIVSIGPGINTVPANICDATTGIANNGSASVISIIENGVSMPLLSYSYVWKDSLNNTLSAGPSSSVGGLVPGHYFGNATNSTSQCFVDYDFTIDDSTIGSTKVSLGSFTQPQRCITPIDGDLTAVASGTGAAYSFEWFSGDLRPNPTGVVLSNAATLSNINVPRPQSSATFTVKVTNASNNCVAVDAYSVPVIENKIVISASTSPLTFCAPNNGSALATVVNKDAPINGFNFRWSIGTITKPTPDFTTSVVEQLANGDYTVEAIDKTDNLCVSNPVTVTVTKEQILPVVSARVLQNLTVCDTIRFTPDGVASADVASDVTHYTFDWYKGTTTTGTIYYTGSVVSELVADNYTVLATDIFTQCTATATIKVQENLAVVPDPTIVKISDITSCIADNGELSVSVDGIIKDYIFDWANGANAPPPINHTGDVYSNLSVGKYTVVATSQINGCKSKPKTESIKKDQKFPKIDFLIQSASCSEDNGFITILVQDDISIDTIRWLKDGAVIEAGPNLQNVVSGNYQVSILTTEGCEVIQDVFLPADIQPFNGVSRTDDGNNDYFAIDCIENFPNNHVEVYNRAGTKVYEANGYNNLDVIFEGKSNQGISIMGTSLPAGTYYYVISKGDGSNRLAGYLELVD